MTLPRILAIGGSDSGGGAGIEADIKTITALGGYAMTAITAVTAQDTLGVHDVVPIAPEFVARSIRLVAADLGIDAVKTGMLGSAAMVAAVAGILAEIAPDTPIVIDPVIAATSGAALLAADARAVLLDRLMPMAALITPNRDEAAILSGHAVETPDDAVAAGRILCGRGARAVLVKGGHFAGDEAVDFLVSGDEVTEFRQPRIVSRHTHGTGCTLASAIALGLGAGLGLREATGQARDFLQKVLLAAPGFGAGQGPLGHAAVMTAPGACKAP
ncbi:bifunctional hydroxymethylpyrimidine kinase/phosphomethylpyrimidine kinase [Acidiphilium iwatense]|uniref:hydroxymethylpyrimidine kinase n=1 Tax=Acidiphilium iwatense TaxID=768198 RepID=A0ABS9DSI1_9PROT|nr:bifunctional hydroxymethylpyrimidine kinase/phosphomethylpyrimidine kinase [Acidiphilium iwatense]MCF3945647.1 bifunctional hydroxymethylpyrimidine kinase/phosphomethylpyrimidine kinase [Acidiphilium iwatense]